MSSASRNDNNHRRIIIISPRRDNDERVVNLTLVSCTRARVAGSHVVLWCSLPALAWMENSIQTRRSIALFGLLSIREYRGLYQVLLSRKRMFVRGSKHSFEVVHALLDLNETFYSVNNICFFQVIILKKFS